MIKFIAIIDEALAPAIDSFLLENSIQECTVEKITETNEYFLCGYYEDADAGRKIFDEIKNNFPDIGEVKQEVIREADWVNEYKKYCRPWMFNGFNWVPVWMKDEFKPRPETQTIYIDSSSAFGTGMHETTRLCARALEMFVLMYKRSFDLCVKRCIDVGCGTGILGISALKLGLQSSVFIDNDEQAIKVCRDNVLANDIDPEVVEYINADLKVGLLGRQGDLVFANILANVLIENVDILVASVRPGGLLCLSGVLVEEIDEVKAAFRKSLAKLWSSSLENTVKNGEWGALMFCRG